MLSVKLSKPYCKSNVSRTSNSATFHYPGPNGSSSCSYAVVLARGEYTFECWGANGQQCRDIGGPGYGGYTKGVINLAQTTTFYLFLGSNIKPSSGLAFNGGGGGDMYGGGATDIRLVDGSWDDFPSLKSRIMVSGGGGGSDWAGQTRNIFGGHGGGLIGSSAISGIFGGDGGTQISCGVVGFAKGGFGYGGSTIGGVDNGGGGGGGYYGGNTGQNSNCCGGGGGSSFISGHDKCDAVNSSSTKSKIIHSHQSIHYSGIFFSNTSMINGNAVMPQPEGASRVGFLGSGVIRISTKGNLDYRPSGQQKKVINCCLHQLISCLMFVGQIIDK